MIGSVLMQPLWAPFTRQVQAFLVPNIGAQGSPFSCSLTMVCLNGMCKAPLSHSS